MPETDDKQLISRYLKGDEKSLEILVEKYMNPVFNFVSRYVDSPAETEDITQESFVRMWKNIKKFDPEKNFKSWIFTIAKNIAIDFLRKKKEKSFSEFENGFGNNPFLESLADNKSGPAEIFDRQDLAQKINSALAKVSSLRRQVVSLRYNESLTFREIAKHLKEPLHTVKSRCRRTLLALKEILT